MDNFSKLSVQERKPYFETAAAQVGLAKHIVEKDFWVCWTLKRLFTLPLLQGHIIFKGGTSLSKVFQIIERFSEDIDISLSKELLGFNGDQDPEASKGTKQRARVLEALSEACKRFVQTQLKSELEASIKAHLSDLSTCHLEIDSTDSSGQTLLFHYPSEKNTLESYIRPWVKIELGSRSDNWPSHSHMITPMLNALPQTLVAPEASVKTLDAARTFWEKATILHSFANYPETKNPEIRQSRHYYDFYKLLQSKHKTEALSDLALLARVAEHKSIYFRAGWARYETAKKGTLKLMPGERISRIMKQDYEQMQEMFFTAPPSWNEISKGIQAFEAEFNKYK